MRLSAKMLKNALSVNYYQYEDQVNIIEGQDNEFYFQLVNLDLMTYGKDSEALPDHPLRYMPASGATVTASFDSLFDENKFEKSATQPFPQDPSIWKITFAADELPRTGNFSITLNENGSIKKSSIRHAISVHFENSGGC
jgi:hypothetical protein